MTNESEYLSGKVRKSILPVFNGPAPSDAPRVKRLMLPQGELAQMHEGEEPIRYIAFIELREGTERGNHVHRFKKEYAYILGGELLLVVEDTDSKVREEIPLRSGELVVISPGVAHVMRVLKSGQAIEFSPVRFDPGDTQRYPLNDH